MTIAYETGARWWGAGLSRGEREAVTMHIVGWFSGHDPAEYDKALRAALRHLDTTGPRDTTTR